VKRFGREKTAERNAWVIRVNGRCPSPYKKELGKKVLSSQPRRFIPQGRVRRGKTTQAPLVCLGPGNGKKKLAPPLTHSRCRTGVGEQGGGWPKGARGYRKKKNKTRHARGGEFRG